jgi:hypothetical protein
MKKARGRPAHIRESVRRSVQAQYILHFIEENPGKRQKVLMRAICREFRISERTAKSRIAMIRAARRGQGKINDGFYVISI